MYGYKELMSDVELYSGRGVDVFSIGKSRLGRELWCFAVGKGKRALISTGAIHARENVSALVVMSQFKYALGHDIGARRYFIPLVNPDGAELLRSYFEDGDETYKLWKANAAGVDLNVNFPARWGQGRHNTRVSGSENYIGETPLSEPESAALAEFTKQAKASLTLSYHTAGREFYWYFFQTEYYKRDLALAKFIERKLGYKYRRIDSDCQSAGGYKDYCVQELNIPAFTIELGDGVHPLEEKDVEQDIKLNEPLLDALAERIT